MKVISLLGEKGGVGKTTLAINLAITLSNMEYKVALLDADPNRNASKLISLRDSDKPIDAFPASTQPHKDVKKYKKYDFVIIDSPGRVVDVSGKLNEGIAISTVACSHLVIVPTSASPNDILGAGPTIDLIHRVNQDRGKKKPKVNYYFLLSMVQGNTRLARDAREHIRRLYNDKGKKVKIFETETAPRIAYQESLTIGESVTEYQGIFGRAKREINALTEEVLKNAEKIVL